ncbi:MULTISPECIES: phage Gp19/Gp15/Gp42 family protein [Halomonas]|uniref:phage Gp19/Gp15/Gp42 family protein n=1 Tax=Halomonas TaxID=2745 RepID=UPI001C98D9FA|nr:MULTISPECIES: phage Gp19/Gp15/Gp42 family protein [Halomonas]MBY6208780.1 phage Gp19/Gp15/Gp42 family protein [Halomonas sp. DP3Y7-2]MBY6227250.1 phage Gp19/Gp15/Gp42 family protein [Halomonas sp. DP3Y7-1]MCA0915000.1 phage Gp19/Gp15/Gp42 family protein [Halomonas denitrificans]
MGKVLAPLVAATSIYSCAASADVVDIPGLARAFFPSADIEEIQASDSATQYNYIDSESVIAYNLYVVKGHEEDVTPSWADDYIAGNAAAVPESQYLLIEMQASLADVTTDFYIDGRINGQRFEKICRLLMNQRDYGTWCVATLGSSANTKKAFRHFEEFSDDFELLE